MKMHILIITLICMLLLTACGLDTSGLGPPDAIWLDGPILPEAFVGERVAVTVHANYELAEVIIAYRIAGSGTVVPLETVPMQLVGSAIYEAIYFWPLLEPGGYVLRAYSAEGVLSSENYILVNTRTSIPPPEPTPTPLALPMTSDTPIPTTTLSSILPDIQFSADAYDLPAGGCTFLRWSTVFVDSAYLNGEPVELMHSQQVCPAASTIYVLHGDYSGGSVEKTITINVTPLVVPTTEVPVSPPPEVPPPPPPPDTQGPTISAITKSAESIYDGTTCGVASNTISASVSDPSGVGEVVLWYRTSKNSPVASGEWRSITMTKISGNTYQAVLGTTQLSSSLALYTDGTVEFYIISKDGKGNTTQSGILTFITVFCLG